MAERQVRFFEVVTQAREHIGADLAFDELLDEVIQLPDEKAYVQLHSLEVLGSIYQPPSAIKIPRVPMLMLDRIDRDVRLRIERRRNYRPLALADDETLAEPTFFAMFPRNVLAMMRNSGSSPGVASLRDYINKLELVSEPIEIIPLTDTNAIRALRDVGTMTRFDFAVGADVVADTFDRAPFIRSVIQSFRQELGAVSIEVSVKISPRGASSSAEATRDQVESVVTSPAVAHMSKAAMHYRRLEDGKAQTYDFVNEAVAHTGSVELDPETSKPTEVSASEGIARAYSDLYDDIQASLNSTS